MAFRFTVSDVAWLSSASGIATLAEVSELELSDASLVTDLGRSRRVHGDRAGSLIETVRLRRRARAKLPDTAHWLFTDEALQQATPTIVAGHRAQRLAGRAVHDVTCSIGGELAALVPACPVVIGSDLDPVRLAMAVHNVPAARCVRADALVPVTRDAVVVADPARRVDGRRSVDPNRLQPPLPQLLETYRDRDIVVKCAPGLDFARFDWAGEIEVTSLDGRVREACLWSNGLTDPGVRRRARVLSSDGATYTVTDIQSDDVPSRPPGEWIINPDGAVVRAGLVRQYAAEHGLWQLDPHIAYLTGDRIPAGTRGFRILDQLPFRDKTLRTELARRGAGSLEILARGVDVDPDRLRAGLKLRGSLPYALIITRIGRGPTAFLCEPGAMPSISAMT